MASDNGLINGLRRNNLPRSGMPLGEQGGDEQHADCHCCYCPVCFTSITNAQSPGEILVTSDYVQTSFDKIPRFCNLTDATNPVIVSAGSGDWSNPSIWSGGLVPGIDARIQISSGHTVRYDLALSPRFSCIEVTDQAKLEFAVDRSTQLIIDELMVMPGGELQIGDAAQPLPAIHLAEVTFRGDTLLKTGTVASPGIDPFQFGKGLVVLGKMRVYGRQVTYPYIRFAAEPLAAQQTIVLEHAPIEWRVGDKLLIPDTRQIAFTPNNTFVSQAEEVEIAAINGPMITLTQPLAFDHRGPRDVDGNVGLIEQKLLPHVANLTRNIVFKSENTADLLRGHALFTHRADVDIRYASFDDMGRTNILDLDSTVTDETGAIQNIGSNQVGRYSVHLHHLWGPPNLTNTGFQYQFIGNVLNGMNKWGLTIHDTHYGLIQGNIAYDGKGSAIATEMGNEAHNVIEKNFVVHSRAGDTIPILGPGVGRGGVFNTRALFGTTRDAYWFSGAYNYVRD